MSQSPYAGTNSPSGFEALPPARTSVLAVLAVIVAILCVPGTGLLAILFGAIALAAIGRSQGALEGRGAAISGIILGLITTVLWGAAFMGVLQVWTFYSKHMVATTDRFFQAASAHDYDAAREEFSENAALEITDEQMAWFIGEVESRAGEVQQAATSVGTIFEAFGEVFGQGGHNQGNAGPNFQVKDDGNDNVIPVALECANESVLVWVIFDEDSLDDPEVSPPNMVDVFVLFSNGDVVALRHDGPAAAKAVRSGMTGDTDVIQPELPTPGEGAPAFPTPDPPRTDEPEDPTS